MQGSPSAHRSAVRSGVLTGISTIAVSGSAALAGAILSHHFGRGVETDGFFAAYAGYVVLVLVASALRVVVLPRFARARTAGTLGREVGSWALALGLPLAPALALTLLAPDTIAGLLTGDPAARPFAVELLPWLLLAAAAQVFAGIAASALAAFDDYATAALGFSAGGVVGVVVIVALLGHGVAAFGWGLAANGGVSLAIPLLALLARGGLGRPDRAVLGRLRALAEGAALPFALQGLYLLGYRAASGLGSGKPTTFAYAYLIASLLVAVTATSVALVSSVPLTRGTLTPERVEEHVVASSWLSLVLVAGAAGLFSLAGERVARLGLGSHYGGGTGVELGRLVALFAPWMVVSVAVSVAFPLVFVRGTASRLPLLAIAALVVQLPVEWGARSLAGLAGIAVGLAVTTTGVLIVLLRLLGSLRATALGLLRPAAVCGSTALVCFGAAWLLLPALPAAVVGLGLYGGALAVWRPAGLRSGWAYLRQLG